MAYGPVLDSISLKYKIEKKSVTSLHPHYLCLCLSAKNLSAALSILDTDIISLNYEVNNNIMGHNSENRQSCY